MVMINRVTDVSVRMPNPQHDDDNHQHVQNSKSNWYIAGCRWQACLSARARTGHLKNAEPSQWPR